MNLIHNEGNGNWREINEAGPKVQAVTAADVQRVANQYFTKENRAVAIYTRKAGTAKGRTRTNHEAQSRSASVFSLLACVSLLTACQSRKPACASATTMPGDDSRSGQPGHSRPPGETIVPAAGISSAQSRAVPRAVAVRSGGLRRAGSRIAAS